MKRNCNPYKYLYIDTPLPPVPPPPPPPSSLCVGGWGGGVRLYFPSPIGLQWQQEKAGLIRLVCSSESEAHSARKSCID